MCKRAGKDCDVSVDHLWKKHSQTPHLQGRKRKRNETRSEAGIGFTSSPPPISDSRENANITAAVTRAGSVQHLLDLHENGGRLIRSPTPPSNDVSDSSALDLVKKVNLEYIDSS